MAQSSSVAREPSMEEILASIRKIIEDNDSGRPAGDPRTASDLDGPRGAEADDFLGTIDEEDDRPLAIRPDNINRQPEPENFQEGREPAFRAEVREATGRDRDPERSGIALDVSSIGWRPDALPPEALPHHEPRPVQPSAAGRPELQAEPIRPAPVRPDARQPASGVAPRAPTPADPGRTRQAAAPELRPTIHDRPMPAAIAPAARPQAVRPPAPPSAPIGTQSAPKQAGAAQPAQIPAAQTPSSPAPGIQTAVSNPVRDTTTAASAVQSAPRVPGASEPASDPAGRLVSPATISKVSAAFDDLNHAVEVETRRTFDEIAEEILRPMLQDWLDDNLPRLVERLVREEIQRVARGIRS